MARWNTHELRVGLALVVVLSLAVFSYSDGLSGPFLFDDFANLPALGDYNGVRNLETLELYLSKGHAGPTGRPLSLLSFLLDDNAWPSDSYRFKRTNLLLHLLNGILLFVVIRSLLRLAGKTAIESDWTALLASSIWLLHPLFVSTTLYVVQRMAILPVVFVLSGLILYLTGRRFIPVHPKLGYVLMSLAVVLGTSMAALSKENGVLFPLLLLVMERTLLSQTRIYPSAIWVRTFLVLPSLVVVGYLVYKIPSYVLSYQGREFNIIERLLTESRIVSEYLYRLMNPFAGSRGLLTDGYPISRSLVDPVTTLPSLLFIVLLLMLSWRYRFRFPLSAFALLFFLSGHILESTVVPLELYFEHRNYLPSLFLFLPLSYGIVRLADRYRPAVSFAPVLLIGLSLVTHQQAEEWSNEKSLLLKWALENPFSVRALRSAALKLEEGGSLQNAVRLMESAQRYHPRDVRVALHLMLLRCKSGVDVREDLEGVVYLLEKQKLDFRMFRLIEGAVNAVHSGNCSGIAPVDAYRIVTAASKNPNAVNSAGAMRQIEHLLGKLALQEGKGILAKKHFVASQKWKPDIEAGLLQVGLLASAGYYSEAMDHLRLVKKKYVKEGGNDPYYIGEINRINSELLGDLGGSVSIRAADE